MIKIVTKKKWKAMLAEIDDLRGARLALDELLKGHYNKYQYEKGQLEDTLKARDEEIKELKKQLRKSEHERKEAFKKLKKYESSGK